MTTKTETWLDIMPAIPLTLGVPVRFLGSKWAEATIVSMPEDDGVPWMFSDEEIPDVVERPNPVPNLDHAQGFGYALRYWTTHRTEPEHSWCSTALWNWMHDKVNDTDRVALAKALRELVS